MNEMYLNAIGLRVTQSRNKQAYAQLQASSLSHVLQRLHLFLAELQQAVFVVSSTHLLPRYRDIQHPGEEPTDS